MRASVIISRASRAAPLALVGVWLVLGGPVGCEGEFFETSHGAVDEANEALEAGDPAAALVGYDEAAAELPAGGALAYDRGLALSEAGKHDEATQELLKAVSVDDKGLLQRVYAALGLAYSRWARDIERGTASATADKPADGAPDEPDAAEPEPEGKDPADKALPKWDKAVTHLEEALLLDPADAASLRNLEVALRRVDPPCRARDDELEPNASHAAAAAIELSAGEEAADLQSGAAPAPKPTGDRLSWKRQLYSCPDDTDWYKLELGRGDRLAAELTISGAGRLALELVAPDGQRQLRPPPEGALVSALELTVSEPGTYFLRVRNLDYDEVSYSLEVVVRPPCAANEDRFEDNDGPAQAQMLTPGQLQGLKICPDDEDWYRVQLGEGESLFAYASLAQDPDEEDKDEGAVEEGPPPLELEIRRPSGEVVGTGAPSGQARVASVLTPGVGQYLVRLRGDERLEARYDLLVRVIPPCPEGDDEHEDNDAPWAATDLDKILEEQAQQQAQQQGGGAGGGKPAPLFLRICAADRDWFTISADPEQPTVISSVFEHDKGDLRMVLYDERGREEKQRSDTSSADTNGEALVIDKARAEDDDPSTPGGQGAQGGVGAPPAPGEKFALLVDGKGGGENFYLLSVQRGGGGGGDGGDSDQQQDDQEQDQQDPQNQQDPQDQQDQQDPEDPQDPKDQEDQQDQQDPQPREDRTLEAMLDEMDHNPKNLEAERAKALPLANTPPEKDW